MDAPDRRRLLDLARRSLEAQVHRAPPPTPGSGGVFDIPAGAFVSIHHHGELRGCLGRIESSGRLVDTVVHLASIVGQADPRFPPVRPDELDGISLEISVLTEPTEVETVDEIEVGRHGLIVEQGLRRGLLLPQVAMEYRWDRDTFLEHTCLKAGLPKDAWKRGARILVFEAEVFGEEDQASR
jgi:AmmeMemoRadiSam system protein A